MSSISPSQGSAVPQASAPAPEQVHAQFGAGAATQAAVSWAAPGPARRPRLRLVHVIVGGGGSSSFFTPPSDDGSAPAGKVITGVGPGDPHRQRPPIVATEPARWSAYRDLRTPYGFTSFDVVPAEAGGTTSITVTYHGAGLGSADYAPLDRFILRKRLGAGTRDAPTCYAGVRLAARRTPA